MALADYFKKFSLSTTKPYWLRQPYLPTGIYLALSNGGLINKLVVTSSIYIKYPCNEMISSPARVRATLIETDALKCDIY